MPDPIAAVDAAAEIAVYPPKNGRSLSYASSSPPEIAIDEGISSDSSLENDGTTLNASSLPPVDAGYAWVFLACAFTAE